MKYINNFFPLITLVAFLFAPFCGAAKNNDDQQPILVRLSTESQRIPLYLTHIACEDNSIDSSLCNKLEKVLQFDLDHNGMTYIVPSTKDNEKTAGGSQFSQGLRPIDWKNLNAFYVVKVRIQEGKLSARLFAANSESAKSIDGIPLQGNLPSDRRQIHQLADSIHKALFGNNGIASTRFVYTVKSRQGKKWLSDVWEADYDGENKRQLTFDGAYAITPGYVPPKPGYSSGTVFYVSYTTGQPKIYYQPLTAGSKPLRLTYMRGNQLMPTINRQRDKLAFISDVTGNPDLFILPFNPEVGATGKPYQIFSTHLATQGTPTFSPDGEKIAFVSNKDGSPRIYMMPVPASGTSLKDIKATLITKRNRESSAPAWSPDGTKIAFCSTTDGVRQVWVYDFSTREERQLTQGPGNKENPTWAPNSLHLIFNSSDAGSCDLFLMNLNQPDVVKISSGSGERRFPAWEPRQ